MNALQVAVLRAKCSKFNPPIPPTVVPEPPPPELPAPPRPIPKHVLIQRVVADFYGITRGDILSQSRYPRHVQPRFVAIYLCREQLIPGRGSTSRLGRLFGYRDHTSIIHALRAINRRLVTEELLCMQVSQIRARLADAVQS